MLANEALKQSETAWRDNEISRRSQNELEVAKSDKKRSTKSGRAARLGQSSALVQVTVTVNTVERVSNFNAVQYMLC